MNLRLVLTPEVFLDNLRKALQEERLKGLDFLYDTLDNALADGFIEEARALVKALVATNGEFPPSVYMSTWIVTHLWDHDLGVPDSWSTKRMVC